jgi:cyclophilin family peptidyl-prolyl cis-trans isomerase
MAQLAQDFPADFQFVYRHFPIPSHDKANLAAQAAEAAGAQGQFWPMHDLLFARQDQWAGLSVEAFQPWLSERAAELDLDVAQFEADLVSQPVVERVSQALDEASRLGLPGTPTLAINGQYYDGPRDYANLAAIIHLIKLEERQFTECPPVTVDPLRQYFATLRTARGDIVIELLAEQAPLAVNSFIFLARNDWFDGVTFHRVIPGFVAQSGDPTGTGIGGPGYAFKNETDSGLGFDGPGVVGMANAGPDSNGSQFFITYAVQERLNGGYTVFGRVVSGMDVVESLTPRDPAKIAGLPPGDAILDVIIEER